MPRISIFYGIVTWMYHEDHGPPHFHASYGGRWAVFSIATAQVLAGSLPARERRLVKEWTMQHRPELLQDWDLAHSGQPLLPIAPLP